MQCSIFNSLLALLHTGWPNLSPLSFFVPKEWWKRYRNDCCSMRKEWRYGFQWKDFCNIGKTCKGSRCNPSATQELSYTGDTLTLHWKNVRYGVHRHGAGSKIGGAVEWSWETIHYQYNSGSLSPQKILEFCIFQIINKITMNKEEMGYDLETSEFLSLSLFCNASKNSLFYVAKI